jgi:hypothetical protein
VLQQDIAQCRTRGDEAGGAACELTLSQPLGRGGFGFVFKVRAAAYAHTLGSAAPLCPTSRLAASALRLR